MLPLRLSNQVWREAMGSFHDYFIELSGQLAEHYTIDCVAEMTPAPHTVPVDERLVQCIWAEQMVHADRLITVSGQSLRVVRPGDWNTGPGPDFLNAELLIDDRACKGDIEVHLRSSDFRGHGHDRDFVYNRVALHVFLALTDGQRRDMLHNGEYAERLELEPVFFPDLETIRRTLNPDEFPQGETSAAGRCAPVLENWDFEQLKDFLNAAGRERLETKTRRLTEQLRGESPEQAFYQSLMTTMGQRGGKALYFLLAKRTPVEELRDYLSDAPTADRALLLEAIFLHVAGLTPAKDRRAKLDEEERAHLAHLEELWGLVQGYFGDRLIPPTRRWLSGVRPVNFATRRLAGIARWLTPLLAEKSFLHRLHSDCRRTLPAELTPKTVKTLAKQWMTLFLVDEDSFWSWRYNWAGKRAQRPMTLIGESQARSIVLNTLLPALFLLARQSGDEDFERKLWRVWALFPPLAPNRIVKRMEIRLFKNDQRARPLLNTEQRQQALHQIYHQFCNNELQTCERCVFFSTEEEQGDHFYHQPETGG